MPINAFSLDNAQAKLNEIHASLKLLHGSFQEEYPEQLMAVTYITKNARVLELGGNVGRNSCVIAKILKNSKHLVVVEPCLESARLLMENCDHNGLHFYIEPSAVSKTPLVQSEWSTTPSEAEIPGFTRVNIISFHQLEKKYRMTFDTLVADCEGALYYILKDDKKILRNIRLILVENDYKDETHYLYTAHIFKKYGFQLVYNEAGPWGPCANRFYQVWSRKRH